MPSSHSRKTSEGESTEHRSRRRSHSQSQSHKRTKTAPDAPSLLRLPSVSSTAASVSSRFRRTTSEASTPAATATATPAASSVTSPSYFSPQSGIAGQDPRSPGTRRPPASHSSGHGVDNSRGPPVTLLTRGNSDLARRSSAQQPSDFAFAQQQLVQSGLVSPAAHSRSSSRHRERRESVTSTDSTPQPAPQQTTTTTTKPKASSRRNSTSSNRPHPRTKMPSSVDESSDNESGPRSRFEDFRAAHIVSRNASRDVSRNASLDVSRTASGTEGEQNEDLFLNIAADTAPKARPAESTGRIERLKSRMARANNRPSLPANLQSPSPVPSNTTTTTRIVSTSESRPSGQRRSSLLPTPSIELHRRSPAPAPINTPRTRELSHKASFSSRRDADLSPREFLAQIGGTRRGSQPDALQTPPHRTPSYKPSNLNYSSTRDDPQTPRGEPIYETASRADGTESHGSTGPATSVWDELDELKTRIRKIELGGKIPSTSGAAVNQAVADRPRTANTSATTVSSSPNQQRKTNVSPPESRVGAQTPGSNNSSARSHPLLRDALAKARQNISPAVYRTLEATATEALTLAEMAGSAGPQGTLHSASSILGGNVGADRQVRRKADNICRSLTELCIAMCDNKTGLSSPAYRSSASISRRPSVQINGGDSPTIRQSIEPESNGLSNVSPSRAMSRIEARRSMLGNGVHRESSQDALDDRQLPSRLSRAGTSLHRNRGSMDDDDDDPALRAPSRAMTDFRSMRPSEKNRFSLGRQYTSREPMPDLQPSPALSHSASLRRPTVSGINNENSLLFRENNQRYHMNREASPAYEKQMTSGVRARTQLQVARNPNNRNSIGGVSELSRNVSLGRRMRGSSIGE